MEQNMSEPAGTAIWFATVKENEDGDLYLDLPSSVCEFLDLKDDSSVMLISHEDGSFELCKIDDEEEDVGC